MTNTLPITPPSDYPFTVREFQCASGPTMRYIDQGDGPPVLMVHGNPTWSYYYRHLVNDFAPNYRCLVPDHVGMGLSSRPSKEEYSFRLADRVADLTALMDSLNLKEPAHLIVHDWGGPIGLGWAAARPQMVASVTLLNTGTRIPPDYQLPWQLTLFKKAAPLGVLLAQYGHLFARGLVFMGTSRTLSPEVKNGLLAPYNRAEKRLAIARFIEDIPLEPSHPSWKTLAGIDKALDDLLAKIPLTLVWGGQDFVFSEPVLKDWQQRFPHAESLVFPHGGHYVLEDEPEKISTHILNFWQTLKNNGRAI